jgi:hypothetical protein
VDLYWIPLGAGGCSVALNGRVYERVAAARRHRKRCALYHAALVVEVDGERYTIELTPSPDEHGSDRGVVATGPVGARAAGRFRVFRYELRCWRGGTIPDLDHAVERRRLTTDPQVARRLLRAVPHVPTLVWGRDELGVGDMWNSNSVVSWVLSAAGLPAGDVHPPAGGRAPGWGAGVAALRVFPDRGSGSTTPIAGGSRGWRGPPAEAACALTSTTRSKEES